MRGGVPVVLALALLACGSPKSTPPPPPSNGPLPKGVVARVGDELIAAEEVARIAARQHLDAKHACDLAVHDALFATEARARGIDRRDLEVTTKIALAQRVLKAIQDHSRAPPANDEELARATARHWLDLDRPEAFLTVHAVVRFDPRKVTPAERKRALDVAAQIRSAAAKAVEIAKATQPPEPPAPRMPPPVDPVVTEFEKDANAVAHPGFEVKVETLAPVAADGRQLDGSNLVAEYAKAAASLVKRGDVSDIVVTEFGAHVIVLLDRIPAARAGADERRAALTDEIFAERAAKEEKAIVDRSRINVGVERDVDALLALVHVGDESAPKP